MAYMASARLRCVVTVMLYGAVCLSTLLAVHSLPVDDSVPVADSGPRIFSLSRRSKPSAADHPTSPHTGMVNPLESRAKAEARATDALLEVGASLDALSSTA